MAKYPDQFDKFDRERKAKQAKTLASLIGGFAVFCFGMYYVMAGYGSGSPTAKDEQDIVQPSAIPEEPATPVEIAQVPTAPPVEQAPPPMTPAKKAKKVTKAKVTKKIAKKKSAKKDSLVCIPPSRLKALENQVARSSHR